MNKQISQQFDGVLRPLEYGVLFNDSGAQVYPDTVTLTITRDDTVPIALDNSPVIDSDTGIASYTFSANDSAILNEDVPAFDNRARWTFTEGAETFERTQYFDTVFAELRSRVTDSELISVMPQLAANRKPFAGDATGGSTTTVIDTDRLGIYPAEFFLGAIISFQSGSNEGKQRMVTLFDAANSTLTVSPALDFSAANNDMYTLEVSYNPQIRQAWKEISSRTVEWFNKEIAARVLDGADFSSPHLSLSLAMASEILIQGKEDQYDLAAARHRQDYQAAMSGLKVKLDISTEADGSTITTRVLSTVWSK